MVFGPTGKETMIKTSDKGFRFVSKCSVVVDWAWKPILYLSVALTSKLEHMLVCFFSVLWMTGHVWCVQTPPRANRRRRRWCASGLTVTFYAVTYCPNYGGSKQFAIHGSNWHRIHIEPTGHFQTKSLLWSVCFQFFYLPAEQGTVAEGEYL